MRTSPRAKCLFQNNSKIGIDKQKSEWCTIGTLLALANDRSPNDVQRDNCLHWLKLFCLWTYVQLYFENIFPFQHPAYEVCLMGRWSSKSGKHLNQMECRSWNPIHSSLWYFISYAGCYRSGVLAWVKLQLLMSQGTTRVPLFGIKGRQNGVPC